MKYKFSAQLFKLYNSNKQKNNEINLNFNQMLLSCQFFFRDDRHYKLQNRKQFREHCAAVNDNLGGREVENGSAFCMTLYQTLFMWVEQ
jgi:hypothetical protein